MALYPWYRTAITSTYVLLLSSSMLAQAERYSVEEDSFGGYSAQIIEAKEPETKESEAAPVSEPESASPAESTQTVQLPQPAASVQSGQLPQSAKSAQAVQLPQSDQSVEPQQKKISIFEQKFIEAERAEKAAILKKIKEGGGSVLKYDATDVNPLNFVDGDDLAKRGGLREVEKAPYYISVDADGRQQTTFYDPALIKEALDKEKDNTLEYTSAQVFKRSDSEDSKLALPEGADPIAAGFLGSTEGLLVTYFDGFVEHCCESLPNRDAPKIKLGKPRFFALSQEELPYRFNEGDSRYLLLTLPHDSSENYPLRLRSFIRKHKKRSIEHGVFFPQIVTLDKEKKPVRIFTGPLLKYHEETWSAHGFLEGIFEIDRSELADERYLLINTTKDALKQSSVIETAV